MLADKPFFLVLEEDGTVVETEEYFQTLADDTVFMALQKGQKWQPPSDQVRCHLWMENTGNQKSLRGANHTLVLMQGSRYQLSLSRKPAKKIDVARVTFDLYKLNPQDFIGCLNVKATLYGTYSLSYNLHCYGAKRIMKWVNWDSLGQGGYAAMGERLSAHMDVSLLGPGIGIDDDNAWQHVLDLIAELVPYISLMHAEGYTYSSR